MQTILSNSTKSIGITDRMIFPLGRKLEKIGGELYEQYKNYKQKMMEIVTFSDKTIRDKILLYQSFLDKIDGKFNAQSQIISSHLEEFLVYLFKDIPEIEENNYYFFGKGSIGICIDNGILKERKNDIDIGIGFQEKLGTINLTIINVAVDAKKNFESTMLKRHKEEARSYKSFNSTLRYFLVTEACGSLMESKGEIDNIFKIRDIGINKSDYTNPIKFEVVKALITAVQENLKPNDASNKKNII